jgi:hypothetical protein
MTRVAAILPCRGRAEQTARNVRRLVATAGAVDWELWLVGARDDVAWAASSREPRLRLLPLPGERVPYWQALRAAKHESAAPLLVNLASDLLPGAEWLARAVAAYDASGGRLQVLAFNDGISSTAHFLIARAWLDAHGGWPVWYDHMCGDTEIVARAKAEGVYATLPWAVLYHDHHITGAAHDAVYAEGERQWERDKALFAERRAQGWPRVE